MSGESGDVNEDTVTAWRERLVTLVRGYSPKDIWNEDETGCFFRALPDKTLADAKKACKGGKKAKIRITLAFFVNSAGEKEMPIVIGKSASPRCFKGIRDKNIPLGVPYYLNAKAWMNSVIMLDILNKINRNLARQKRRVILFLDNVSSHSPDLVSKFSNITVVFLPKNTTSRLQPLDAGIIKNFKAQYRKLIVQHALSKIDGSTLTATQITKSINLLTAIRLVKQAWNAVSADTIVNCFKHCGVQPRTDEVTDPFADLDEESQDEQEGDSGSQDEELQELVQQFDPELNPSDYINADEDLPTSDTYDNNENWRCELRDELLSGSRAKKLIFSENDSEEEDESDVESPSTITTFREAIDCANNLLKFLTQKGEEQLSDSMFKLIQKVQISQLGHSKQMSIEAFTSP